MIPKTTEIVLAKHDYSPPWLRIKFTMLTPKNVIIESIQTIFMNLMSVEFVDTIFEQIYNIYC